MAEFQFNAGRVGGVHIGTVKTADELAGKLEELAIDDSAKKSIMDKFVMAENEFMAKKNPEVKAKGNNAGVGKTLFDAVKNMM